MPKPVTYDHLKSKKKPVVKHVFIALDSEVGEEHAAAEKKVNALRIRHTARPEDEKIIQDLATAEEEFARLDALLKEESVKFTFKSLGRRKYDDLVEAHQPTDGQVEEFKKENPDGDLDFNPETFPQALVAACIVSPELTVSQVNEIFNESDDWNGTELMMLYQTALLANISRGIAAAGNG